MKHLSLAVVLFLGFAGCDPGEMTGKSFKDSGEGVTVNDLATQVSASSGATSASNEDYVGILGIVNGGVLYSGVVKFKMNLQSDTQAFFSNATLERFSRVTNASTSLTSKTDKVTTSTDLLVTSAFSANNTVTVADKKLRYLNFTLTFGNPGAFVDFNLPTISGAGICACDFSTCAGGDDATYIFIFQKGTALPSVTMDAIAGKWTTVNFDVAGNTTISINSTSTLTVDAPASGASTTTFSGSNSVSGAFSGTVGLNDASTGGFVFTYSGVTTHAAAITGNFIDGAFLISSDKNLVLGYDFASGFYFAIER